MTREGPLLETLTRRLAETPPDFLAEPRLGTAGGVHVDAVVADLLRDLGGGPLEREALTAFRSAAPGRQRNRLRLILIVCWLLHDPWFRARGLASAAQRLLERGLDELAEVVPAERCLADADRREEIARLALEGLGLRPAGETEAQARDRLTTLSSIERRRVIAAARAAEARAREVREAMARQAAYDAQAKAMRE